MSYPFDYSAEPFQGFTKFDEFASSDEFDEFGVFGEGEFDEFDEFGEEEFGEPEVFGYGFETEEERGGMHRVPGRASASSGRPPRGRPPAGRPLRARPPRAGRPLPSGRRPGARPGRPGTKPPGRPPGRPKPPRPRPRYPWPIYKPWPGVFPVEAYPQVGRFGNWFRSGDQLILLLDEDATPLAGGAEGAGAPAPAPNGGAPAGVDAGAPSEPDAGAQAEPPEGAEGELYGAGRRPSWRVRRLLRRVAPRTRWAATNQEFNFEMDPLRALAEYGGAFGQFGGGGERETTAAGKPPSRAAAATPVGPFGTLFANAPGRKPFQYGFTAEDVLWTARFLVGEAGGRDNLDNQAVIWAMLNRYALFTHRYYPTFHRFIRAYSTPLQPVLKSSGAAKRHMHKSEFVRTGGTYEGTDIPRGQLARFLKLQQTPWGKLPASARSLAERALKGHVANPIGNASEFASTRVYFRDRYKRWPQDFEEWRRFTESFAAGKKWVWVGPIAGLDPMNNTFFVQKSVANLAPGTVRVVAGSPSVTQGGGTNQEAGYGDQQFYYAGAPYELESGADWQGEVNRRSRDYIRWVQSSLNRLLSLQLAVDGQIGTQTRSAVRSFQQRAGLPADGDVGPQTEAALVRAGAPSPPGAGASTQTPSGIGGASGGQASGAQPPAPTGPSSGLPGVVSTPCGVRTTKPATDRCTGPVLPTCPPVPDLLCVTSVSGIPFEYVMNSGWVVKGAGGLYVVKNRSARKQNFTPAVASAVARFITNMASIGMPVEAILTGGSYYCRCISHTNTLSNHSFGDAIDVAGIRWRSPTGSRETIVHNYANPGERAILRRINACLRLSFANVIDYHRSDHRDHFHCDTNRGKGRYPKGSTSVVFIKEALNTIMGLGIPETTAYDAATAKGLRDFSGRTADELSNTATLNKVLDDLFARVARG